MDENIKQNAKALILNKVYASYLNAKDNFRTDMPDSVIRKPDLFKKHLRRLDAKRTVVITGSKGKGSIARMTASLLSLSGDCGLFISPHVCEFNERISIDNENISYDKLLYYVDEAVSITDEFKLDSKRGEYASPIGILAVCAVNYFYDMKCDFAIFECGRGARYDDVNRIPHEYAVIGTIFKEHSSKLGNTTEDIAFDKAHVISEDTRVVYSMPQEPSVMDIIRRRADKMGAKLYVCDEDFKESDYKLRLNGGYQKKHAEIALRLSRDILKENDYTNDISKSDIEEALYEVSIPGRMEIISEKPFIMIDSAINAKSAIELSAFLRERQITDFTTIMCLPDDKDYVGVARELDRYSDKIILSKIYHPHYRMEENQQKILADMEICAEIENDFKKAYFKALRLGKPIVIVCANTFVHIIKDIV